MASKVNFLFALIPLQRRLVFNFFGGVLGYFIGTLFQGYYLLAFVFQLATEFLNFFLQAALFNAAFLDQHGYLTVLLLDDVVELAVLALQGQDEVLHSFEVFLGLRSSF